MNTVLDDNKMFTFANGKRVKLNNTVSIVFEVDNLSQASPATVSRCGMIFLESVHLGWAPLVRYTLRFSDCLFLRSEIKALEDKWDQLVLISENYSDL